MNEPNPSGGEAPLTYAQRIWNRSAGSRISELARRQLTNIAGEADAEIDRLRALSAPPARVPSAQPDKTEAIEQILHFVNEYALAFKKERYEQASAILHRIRLATEALSPAEAARVPAKLRDISETDPTWVDPPVLGIADDEPGARVPETAEPVAWRDVKAERKRQIIAEGWTTEHDDTEHGATGLAAAAGCYALFAGTCPNAGYPPSQWPWEPQWWKPKDFRRDQVRAAALLLAAIEWIDRHSHVEFQPGAPGFDGADAWNVAQAELSVGEIVREVVNETMAEVIADIPEAPASCDTKSTNKQHGDRCRINKSGRSSREGIDMTDDELAKIFDRSWDFRGFYDRQAISRAIEAEVRASFRLIGYDQIDSATGQRTRFNEPPPFKDRHVVEAIYGGEIIR